MILGIYFLIAFIVFFFLWKNYAGPAIEKMGKHDHWVDLLAFHHAIWGSLFWALYVPALIIWKLLEKITGK